MKSKHNLKPAEPVRHYDLAALPQPRIRDLYAEIGMALEAARKLEGERRCSTEEVDLAGISAKAQALKVICENIQSGVALAKAGH